MITEWRIQKENVHVVLQVNLVKAMEECGWTF